jgi:hypothetical protein
MNKRRLLNVAKALREAVHPEYFTMRKFGLACKTPACAFGHYAVRKDMQKVFSLSMGGYLKKYRGRLLKGCHDDLVLDHFGITQDQSIELFGAFGCGHAQTPVDAAEFIENFVVTHS